MQAWFRVIHIFHRSAPANKKSRATSGLNIQITAP